MIGDRHGAGLAPNSAEFRAIAVPIKEGRVAGAGSGIHRGRSPSPRASFFVACRAKPSPRATFLAFALALIVLGSQSEEFRLAARGAIGQHGHHLRRQAEQDQDDIDQGKHDYRTPNT